MILTRINGHKKSVSLKRNDEKADFQNYWLFFRKRVYLRYMYQYSLFFAKFKVLLFFLIARS